MNSRTCVHAVTLQSPPLSFVSPMPSAALPLLMAVAAILGGSARCGFASDTITADSAVSGGRTIVSRGGSFELGFFSPAGSSDRNYYVGIWYKKAVSQCTPVWVANRAAPVSDPASSKLAVTDGKLVWSSNVSSAAGSSNSSAVVVAVILDTGNLVLRREDDGEVLWQSVEHPHRHVAPGGPSWHEQDHRPRAGSGFLEELRRPGSRRFQLRDGRLEREQPVQIHLEREPFLGQRGVERQLPQHIHRVLGQVRLRVRVRRQRHLLHLLPAGPHGDLQTIWMGPLQHCDVYAVCGAFGVCTENNDPEPSCSCPAGFRPSSERDWELGDRSRGCRRNNPLRCNRTANSSVHGKDDDDDGDAFLLAPGISLPINPSPAQASSGKGYRLACLRGCNCTAYSYGSNCSLWYGDLLNLEQVYGTAGMDDLYIRLSSAMDVPSSKGHKRMAVFVPTASSVASILALAVMVSVAVIIRKFRRRQRSITLMHQAASEGGNLVVFKYSDVKRATKNFSEKLGGGAFGSVYKGTLPGSSAAIAVKKLEGRLCGMVGEKQFGNEVRTIGVIQHVNLVRLRGFCSHGGERLLVYDLIPNGSLDKALFGAGAPALSWPERFRIAVGVARGLQYLHEECRECIIHCDVKPENILLDAGLVAKVADFGMAKLVGREFSRVLTTARGTVGYLAPEWIAGVPVTAKADVYSYGMVLLEIVSGRRNARCFGGHGAAGGPVLLGVLPAGGGEDGQPRVACWCVQDDEARRPTMEQVVRALEGAVAVDVPPVPRSLQALVEGSGSVMSARTSACFASIASSESHLGVQNSF
ncbi:unnamed protein product [Urochloa decumbens]|uniref:Receptor-like serine/threonine-protein kinase n=1 Tax=Urochloa decumbens TaxID=240449 RepID=A0ABC9H0Y4_9POAL